MKSLFLFVALTCAASPITNEIPPDYDRLVDSIDRAEGGIKAAYPYGIRIGHRKLSRKKARQLCYQTCRNHYQRWQSFGATNDYIESLCDRYCPESSDQQGNANLKKNVRWFMAQRP